MSYQFTPAAERAFQAAGSWTLGTRVGDVLAPTLLLGLLAEEESRAAQMLATYCIGAADVRTRWPELRPLANNEAGAVFWGLDVEASLTAALERLADHPRPLVIGTEQLLLGLLAAQHETAHWLAGRGLDVEQIAAQVHRLHGVVGGPIAIDWDSSTPLPLGEGGERSEPGEGEPRQLAHNTPSSGLRPPSPKGRRTEAASHEVSVLRILDAAANRAREGLRVVEDYARFVLDDRHLTEQLKTARHDLATALAGLGNISLMAGRDTPGDVGTSVSTLAENMRRDPAAVATASCKRTQEALRSLEEYGKLIAPAAAAQLEQLRYRVYTLERALVTTATNVARLASARLYVLVDGRESLAAFRALVATLVEAEVDVLQLRDEQLPDRELLARAESLRQATAGSRTLFIMNDRPDLARLADADGVHVGQDELPVAAARRIVGPDALVGVSTHSLAQARQAVLDGTDYLGVGPTFPSTTKAFPVFPGLELCTAVAAEIRLPAFAIGGITSENVSHVLATGIGRIALSAAIIESPDPASAARMLQRKLHKVAL